MRRAVRVRKLDLSSRKVAVNKKVLPYFLDVSFLDSCPRVFFVIFTVPTYDEFNPTLKSSLSWMDRVSVNLMSFLKMTKFNAAPRNPRLS